MRFYAVSVLAEQFWNAPLVYL
ncbi:hypothetical protein ECRM12761_0795 [Escherichia coli O145:H28 str. RM12761]|uniref:Uncharacterized protein n=1 Tax=Escherichia coli O145:H28 (strain RM12581) TaxID=1248823 RepID=A0ABC7ZLJ6_ECOLR|nr:hypothetical protein ECRM13514_0156 [Escherichia coli O145:H28 str. RM13514]AHG12855.1 hypothetical protein ECRM13516_0159 [Escherichia coli O145:H28 str. RM13516]AHY63196.1 hypothetical protein ECRM12761_0795 [Escherichia coli O145:H28 str. RM12761]AHY68686.1 hypothetical protein ECRM12581_0780 [Escherichia coli O145:H28 str. RM12581]